MLTDKQLNKMEQMLKALHNPNFEENLKRATQKLQAQINNGEIKQNGKRKKLINEMDLVNEINKAEKQEKLNNMKDENDFKKLMEETHTFKNGQWIKKEGK